jgi:hypothetical protein
LAHDNFCHGVVGFLESLRNPELMGAWSGYVDDQNADFGVQMREISRLNVSPTEQFTP